MPSSAASGLAVAVARALPELVTDADVAEDGAGGRRIGFVLESDADTLAVDETCDEPAEDAAALVLAAAEAAVEDGAARDEDEGDNDEVAEGDDEAAEKGDEVLPFTPKPVITQLENMVEW